MRADYWRLASGKRLCELHPEALTDRHAITAVDRFPFVALGGLVRSSFVIGGLRGVF